MLMILRYSFLSNCETLLLPGMDVCYCIYCYCIYIVIVLWIVVWMDCSMDGRMEGWKDGRFFWCSLMFDVRNSIFDIRYSIFDINLIKLHKREGDGIGKYQ